MPAEGETSGDGGEALLRRKKGLRLGGGEMGVPSSLVGESEENLCLGEYGLDGWKLVRSGLAEVGGVGREDCLLVVSMTGSFPVFRLAEKVLKSGLGLMNEVPGPSS